MLKGFVFDFDGLILDTELPHFIAWQEVFAEYGQSLELSDWVKIIGTDNSEYDPFQDLYKKVDGKVDLQAVDTQIKARSRAILADQPLQPGVDHFIRTAANQGYALAIATSSSRKWVTSFLTRFELDQFFSVIVTSEDVEKVKPDPALYRLAAQKLGALATTLVGFEDSYNGVKSVKAAGLYCVAVPNTITQNMDFQLADRTIKSFTDISPDEFKQLL